MDVSVERLAGLYIKPDNDELVFSFICRINSGQIMLTDEADQIDWFDLNDIPENTSLRQIDRIRDVFILEQKLILINHQEAASNRSLSSDSDHVQIFS